MSKRKKIMCIILIIIIVVCAIIMLIMERYIEKNNSKLLNNIIGVDNQEDDEENSEEVESEVITTDDENSVDSEENNESDEEETTEDDDEEVADGRGIPCDYQRVKLDEMIINYLYDYIQKVYTNTEDAYNTLSPNYREKFGSLSNYEKYISENKEFFDNIITEKYTNIVEKYDKKNHVNIITFKDSKGRKYTINEKAVMKYTIEIKE